MSGKPKVKASEKDKKRGEYKYTSLKDCKVGGDEQWNFYAVVLDA